MDISSARFIKGILGTDSTLSNGIPHVAFIGRSNVGKSSVINALTKQKDLAITSSFPGRTQQINLFLINENLYLLDLPGYGYAKVSWKDRERVDKLIYWYLLDSEYEQKKVVLIIDAEVGPKETDLKLLRWLEEQQKDIVVVANKVDKMKQSEAAAKLKEIQNIVGHKLIPFSAKKKTGVRALANEILS